MDIASKGFTLLTKISSKTIDRMKNVEERLNNSSKLSNGVNGRMGSVNLKAIQPAFKSNEIKTTLEKPKPVSLVNVSKEALEDLKGIISGGAVNEVTQNNNTGGDNSISNVAKYLAAAAATYAILKNMTPENIPGAITGLQGARRQLTKLKGRLRNSINGIKNVAKKFIPKKLRATLRTNLNSFRKSAVDTIRSARQSVVNGIKNMGSRIVTMSKDLGKVALEKLTKNFNTFKNAAVGLLRSAKNASVGAVDNVATSVARASSSMSSAATSASGAPRAPAAASKPQNIFQRAGSFVADKASDAAKATKSAVGSATGFVVEKGKALADDAARIGGKVGSGIKTAARVVGGKAVDAAKFTFKQGVRALGGVKAVARGILKSPLLAPIVESIFSYIDIKRAIDEYNKGELDRNELDKKVGKRAVQGIGGIAGGLLGATAGAAALGTLSFGLAAPLGAIVGGIGGDMAGRFLGGVVSDVIGDKTDVLGEGIVDSKMFKNKLQENQSEEKPLEIEDGIITKTGELIKPHSQDFIYAMKDGGPLTNAMSKDNEIAIQTQKAIFEANKNSQNLMNNQMKILNENTKLLKQFIDKDSSSSSVISSNSSTTNINYKSSGLREMQLKYV